jgi:hypothetical protein
MLVGITLEPSTYLRLAAMDVRCRLIRKLYDSIISKERQRRIYIMCVHGGMEELEHRLRISCLGASVDRQAEQAGKYRDDGDSRRERACQYGAC